MNIYIYIYIYIHTQGKGRQISAIQEDLFMNIYILFLCIYTGKTTTNCSNGGGCTQSQSVKGCAVADSGRSRNAEQFAREVGCAAT